MAGQRHRNKRCFQERSKYTAERWTQALRCQSLDREPALRIPTPPLRQAVFESALLRALGYGTTSRCPGPRPNPFGVKTAMPTAVGLTLHMEVDDELIDHMVQRLVVVTSHCGTHVHGLPGLRFATKRDRILLTDLVTGARVSIVGIPGKLWRGKVRQYVDDFDEGYRARLSRLDPVSASERADHSALDPRNPLYRTAMLTMSGILRRAGMFRSATLLHFLDLWVDWYDDEVLIHIEWAGDLPHGHVINLLTDPAFGLPVRLASDRECLCDICLYGRYSIRFTDSSGKVRLNLRRSSLFDSVDPPLDCATPGSGPTQERRVRWTRHPSPDRGTDRTSN